MMPAADAEGIINQRGEKLKAAVKHNHKDMLITIFHSLFVRYVFSVPNQNR